MEMILNIKSEFKIMIKEYDWMDAVSKRAVSDKVESIVIKIAYPEFLLNDTYLARMHAPVSFAYFLNKLTHV
jgi:predicted metalloendopeptidase